MPEESSQEIVITPEGVKPKDFPLEQKDYFIARIGRRNQDGDCMVVNGIERGNDYLDYLKSSISDQTKGQGEERASQAIQEEVSKQTIRTLEKFPQLSKSWGLFSREMTAILLEMIQDGLPKEKLESLMEKAWAKRNYLTESLKPLMDMYRKPLMQIFETMSSFEQLWYSNPPKTDQDKAKRIIISSLSVRRSQFGQIAFKREEDCFAPLITISKNELDDFGEIMSLRLNQ